jgi:hypothetical protein
MTLLSLGGGLWIIPVITAVGAVIFWYQVIAGYNSGSKQQIPGRGTVYSDDKTLPIGPLIAAIVCSIVTLGFVFFG